MALRVRLSGGGEDAYEDDVKPPELTDPLSTDPRFSQFARFHEHQVRGDALVVLRHNCSRHWEASDDRDDEPPRRLDWLIESTEEVAYYRPRQWDTVRKD